MRDLISTALTTRRPGAIFIAPTGQAPSRTAGAADVIMSRAHSIFVACRTQNILA